MCGLHGKHSYEVTTAWPLPISALASLSSLSILEAALVHLARANVPLINCSLDSSAGFATSTEESARSDSVVSLHFSILRGRTFIGRLCDCCRCNVGTGCVLCFGPKGPSSTRGHCEFGFCRGTVLCGSRRPSVIGRLCACCNVGACRVSVSRPRRRSFTRRHCKFGLCRDTVPSDSERPSFTSRFHDCCNVGACRDSPSGPRRPSRLMTIDPTLNEKVRVRAGTSRGAHVTCCKTSDCGPGIHACRRYDWSRRCIGNGKRGHHILDRWSWCRTDVGR